MHKNISLKTYLKQGDTFTAIGEVDAPIKNRMYIEGAIEITVNNKRILGREQWDLIDQLWSYLFEGVSSIAKGNDFECTFPDQPILIVMKSRDPSHFLFSIDRRGTRIHFTDFLEEFVSSYRHFLTQLIRLGQSESRIERKRLRDFAAAHLPKPS